MYLWKPSATISLPLHGGHAHSYLVRRMIKLSYAISKVVVDEYGQQEFLRRLADPLWFQAFGCVLGFDWHSSGVTTVVTGVLKQSLKLESEKERAHMASSVRTILETNPQARLFGDILKRLYSYITIVYIDSVNGFALESTFR